MAPKKVVTAAKSKFARKCDDPRFHEHREEDESQAGRDDDYDTGSHGGSSVSELESAELHTKRKAMLGQLTTENKTDSEELRQWKQRKLEEYKDASKLAKNQILAQWIENEGRLKTWYSNVIRSREEGQVWKETQKSGWMKPSLIADLHLLKPDEKEGDKERLEFLLSQLVSRPCPVFGEKFGDKEYYYEHRNEVVDYENNISSGSKVVTQSDIKGKLVDPQLQGTQCLQKIQDKKGIKIENPVLDSFKKEIIKAKKMEVAGLGMLPSLVLLKRQLSEEGQGLCDRAEKNFLAEALTLSQMYEKAERMLKDEKDVDYQDMKCQVASAMSTFRDKMAGLKMLKIELKNMYSL